MFQIFDDKCKKLINYFLVMQNMKVSNLNLLAIKLILSDESKSNLASDLGIDPAILSREIRNKELLRKISDFFDKFENIGF